MNLQQTSVITSRTNVSTHPLTGRLIGKLSQHLLCVSLGIVGGGTGVAIVIAAAVIIQALSTPPLAFLPNVTMLTLIAVLVGLGVSWLFSQIARSLLPSFRYNFNTLGLQIILISSALTSLLENYLFMHNISALHMPANAVWVNLIPLLQAVA